MTAALIDRATSIDHFAGEMVKRAFFESISVRRVGQLLAEADLKPHQSCYWLHPPDSEFAAKVTDICGVYEGAIERADRGEVNL